MSFWVIAPIERWDGKVIRILLCSIRCFTSFNGPVDDRDKFANPLCIGIRTDYLAQSGTPLTNNSLDTLLFVCGSLPINLQQSVKLWKKLS